MSPSRVWKLMTAAQRLRAGQALWAEREAASDQVEAVALIAKQKNFRPKTVSGLDRERKASYLASVPNLPEPLAARLLVLYHLAEARPMMAAFLDAVGIAHENGLIGENATPPEAPKVAAAAAAIAKTYPARDVALYLNTLLWQDPSSWGALQGLPEMEIT